MQHIYILHTRPFRNTSLLVDILTEDHGRLSLVARNARGPRSRYRGQLQLFTPMTATWSGKSELKTLNHLELTGMPFYLNQQALFCGFYLNELLMRLLHKEDAYPCLFSHYQEALTALEKKDDITQTLRMFEKRLLHSLGYGLPLKQDTIQGEPIQSHLYYEFLPHEGFKLSDNNAEFLGADLLAIHHEDFNERVLSAAKRLMRMALSALLGEKPLYSRMLF